MIDLASRAATTETRSVSHVSAFDSAAAALNEASAGPVRTNQEMIDRISAVAQGLVEVCRGDLSQRYDMNVELALHLFCIYATPVVGGAGIHRVVDNFHAQMARAGFLAEYPAGWNDPG
jgi:hypothetical protein